jgi:bis(5'-nucleosyl)-tetraphosphatase (symmetrical)
MSDYLIGDIQGCFDSLQKLLKKVAFSSDKDQLFFLGDVVNRGNKSLETLRFIKDLSENAQMVLGNHDFHLLACALGDKIPSNKDTFSDILNAKDKGELIDFLLQQPLVIEHENALLLHAGVPPNWDKNTLLSQSFMVEKHLKKSAVGSFINQMYGDSPHTWHRDLEEREACRYTINACMRMRFCRADGTLEFEHKMGQNTAPTDFPSLYLKGK